MTRPQHVSGRGRDRTTRRRETRPRRFDGSRTDRCCNGRSAALGDGRNRARLVPTQVSPKAGWYRAPSPRAPRSVGMRLRQHLTDRCCLSPVDSAGPHLVQSQRAPKRRAPVCLMFPHADGSAAEVSLLAVQRTLPLAFVTARGRFLSTSRMLNYGESASWRGAGADLRHHHPTSNWRRAERLSQVAVATPSCVRARCCWCHWAALAVRRSSLVRGCLKRRTVRALTAQRRDAATRDWPAAQQPGHKSPGVDTDGHDQPPAV